MPLAAGGQVRGALLLGRVAARPGFTGTDLGMAASFAGHAAVAMELARARADQITLAQAEDHDRIAGDLHDHVIQDLFALGMRLQGHAARCDPAAAEQVNGYVDTLDEIISKIRTSIFGLHQPRRPLPGCPPGSWSVDEHTAQLGFTAGIRFTGPLDPGRTRRWLMTCSPSPAKPCPTARATPTPPPPPSPWRSATGCHPRHHRQRPRPRHPTRSSGLTNMRAAPNTTAEPSS